MLVVFLCITKMEGTNEKDCSPLWNLYQQIVSDMKVGKIIVSGRMCVLWFLVPEFVQNHYTKYQNKPIILKKFDSSIFGVQCVIFFLFHL